MDILHKYQSDTIQAMSWTVYKDTHKSEPKSSWSPPGGWLLVLVINPASLHVNRWDMDQSQRLIFPDMMQ